MTRIDRVIRELGQLHDFSRELANYRLAMVGDQKMEQRKLMEKQGRQWRRPGRYRIQPNAL